MRVVNSVPRAGIFFVVVASCALPDAAEFTGGSSLDHGRDAGSDSGDSGSGPSTSGAIDGGADAGASLPGCAGHPNALFCADFDGDPYDKGFDANGASGRVASDSQTFVSSPRSLVATLGSRGAGLPFSYLEHLLDGSIISYRVSWSAKLDDSGVQTAVDHGVALSRNQPVYHSLQVRYAHYAGTAPKLLLFEYADAEGQTPQLVDFTNFSTTPDVAQFHRFEMRITQSASASSVTVLLDGKTVLADHALTFHRATGPTRIIAGIGGSDGPGDPVVVHVDDVAVDPP